MKRLVLFIPLAMLCFLSGCRKESEVLIFDALPEERMAARMDELRNKLLEAPYGWKANLETDGVSGSYGFYMDFQTSETLEMIADINETTAVNFKSSTYRIKWVMNASLIFDSYNHITLLQDPTAETLPGTVRGSGLGSDIEFEYVRSTEDSLVLKGRKYQKHLILTKATPRERVLYRDGAYLTAITKTKEFFTANRNTYVDLGGTQIGFALTDVNSVRSFDVFFESGTGVRVLTTTYFHTLEGIELRPALSTGTGYLLTKIVFEGDDPYLVDSEGGRHSVQNSTTPILPIDDMIGSRYSGIRLNYETVYPGTSPAGEVIVRRYVDLLRASGGLLSGFSFSRGHLTLSWDRELERINMTGFHGQTVNFWNTRSSYEYTYNATEHSYELTLRTGLTGGYTAPIMDMMHDFLLNNRFTLAYVVHSGEAYVELTSLDDLDIVIVFQLII